MRYLEVTVVALVRVEEGRTNAYAENYVNEPVKAMGDVIWSIAHARNLTPAEYANVVMLDRRKDALD